MNDARVLLDLALEAARSAGALLLERFQGPARGVSTKSSPTDLVSDADREAERLLARMVESERPEDGILGEEGGGRTSASGLRWILDPLDGTVNFLFRIPAWCVSVAVEDGHGTLVGVVHDPTRDETFSAVRGRGARLNDEVIEVSNRPDLSTALIGTGFAYDVRARAVQASLIPHVLPRVRDIRRAGSAALDLCSVACGRLDGFYEASMEVWDRAAGALIVTESGGRVSELAAPLETLSPGVIAAGPALHDALRDLVSQRAAPPAPLVGSRPMDIVAPEIERYMHELAAYDDEPVLQEMERLAEERGFPIIGRLCGQTLEVVARLGGARRIFELGSGFGYSAYWFSRAVGPQGEIHLTDSDPDNERKARDFLGRAGLDGPINYHVGDALEAFAQTEGDFDIVYCDIDKDGYPDAWRAGRERVKVGGLFISDNMLWSGRITEPEETQTATTRAIDATNHAIAADPDWRSTMVPTRDGVVVALRLR